MNFKLFRWAASMVCFAAMIIGVGFALVGCEKENAGNSNDSAEPTIYGKWQGSEFDIDNNDVWVDITQPPHDADFTFTIQFNEDGTYDGTYDGTGYLGNGGGTFTISNGVITLYKEDIYLYATYRIIELTHEQMEVVVNMNPGVFRFRMQRLLITIEPWEDGGTIGNRTTKKSTFVTNKNALCRNLSLHLHDNKCLTSKFVQ